MQYDMFAAGERESRPEGAYRAIGISHALRISGIRRIYIAK